jgi:integrase
LDALTRRRKGKDTNGADRPKGAAMAGRTAAYGRAAFAWAMKRGAVRVNPFADLPVAKSVGKRERVLTDAEIAEAWHAAGEAGSPYSTIVRLLILTGQRRGEVAGLCGNELSEDLATWTIPSPRTKNGSVHVVPLSSAARNLLKGLLPKEATEARRALNDWRATGALVLPGAAGTPFSGWSKATRALHNAIIAARVKAAAETGTKAPPLVPWTLHDLRRTAATGLQRLGVRLEVTESVLNHISGSRGGIRGVYQQHDWATEKRAALDAWAAHVLGAAEGHAKSPKVVRLRA